jgi:hypothetical protein
MQRENVSNQNVRTQVHALKTLAVVAKEAVFSSGKQNPGATLQQDVDIQIAQAFRLAVWFKGIALGKAEWGREQRTQNRYQNDTET